MIRAVHRTDYILTLIECKCVHDYGLRGVSLDFNRDAELSIAIVPHRIYQATISTDKQCMGHTTSKRPDLSYVSQLDSHRVVDEPFTGIGIGLC